MALTPERLEELDRELDFLDICELVLAFSKKTTMYVSWQHPAGVLVRVWQPRRKKVKP